MSACRRSGVQDAALLLLELGLAENPLALQLAQLLELRQFGVHVTGGLWLRRGRLLLDVLLLILAGPPARLSPRHTIGHGGRRARDDRRARYSSKQTGHCRPLLVGIKRQRRRVMRRRSRSTSRRRQASR